MSPRADRGARYRLAAERLRLYGASVPLYAAQVEAALVSVKPRDEAEAGGLAELRAAYEELGAGIDPGRVSLDLRPRTWLPALEPRRTNPTSGGAGMFERQMDVLAHVPVPPPDIAFHFVEPAYTRRGHFFDMESLGYVVLACWRHDHVVPGPRLVADPYRPSSIWLTMRVAGDGEAGVEIVNEAAPEPAAADVVLDVAIQDPPTVSVRGTVRALRTWPSRGAAWWPSAGTSGGPGGRSTCPGSPWRLASSIRIPTPTSCRSWRSRSPSSSFRA